MWRVLDHTADVALAVEASSWPELLEEAARAFGAWMSGGSSDAEVGGPARTIEVRGADAVETWVHHWKALHRLWTVEGLLAVRAAVDASSSVTRVRASVGCVAAEALEPGAAFDVKAVTWHGARVEEREGGGWLGTIVLDL